MSKLLNGKINECGVIVPLDDPMDIHSETKNSLLYKKYESGSVRASIELAEFDDGQVACSSDVMTSFCGYGRPMGLEDKKEKEIALGKERNRIVSFLTDTMKSNQCSSKTARDCRQIISQIHSDDIPTLSLNF